MKYALNDGELGKLAEWAVSGRSEIRFFDAEMAMVFYETYPDVIKRVVPSPLKPAAQPFAVAYIAIFPRTNFGSVYNESAIFVNVEYKGELGVYCLSMPTTEDMATVLGREVFGFPKKIAEEISLERGENGVRGRVVRRGTKLINLSMSFDDEMETNNFVEMLNGITFQKGGEVGKAVGYNFKYSNSPTMTGFDYKPKLVKLIYTFSPLSKVKVSHNFDLKLGLSERDSFAEIAVKEPILGFYGIFDIAFMGEVVAEVDDELEFMRYAFSRIDYLPE